MKKVIEFIFLFLFKMILLCLWGTLRLVELVLNGFNEWLINFINKKLLP